MRCVGVDGYKGGWIAVTLVAGAYERADRCSDFSEVLRVARDARCVAVDMPIGLVDAGEREADISGREFLGRRRATLFVVPPRAVVETNEWHPALSMARAITGKGFSKQAFALFRKVREVDAHLPDDRIVEVHPEISFQLLAGEPLAPKKTWAGQRARHALLRGAGVDLPDDLGDAGAVPPDDVLDAAIAAVSAGRVAAGRARTFPDAPTQRDRSGQLIALFA